MVPIDIRMDINDVKHVKHVKNNCLAKNAIRAI